MTLSAAIDLDERHFHAFGNIIEFSADNGNRQVTGTYDLASHRVAYNKTVISGRGDRVVLSQGDAAQRDAITALSLVQNLLAWATGEPLTVRLQTLSPYL